MISKITISPTPVGKAVPAIKPKYPGLLVKSQSTAVKFCCARLLYVFGMLFASTNSSGWLATLETIEKYVISVADNILFELKYQV